MVAGNSKTARLPHFNGIAHEQGRFCRGWHKSSGLDFFSTAPPPIQPENKVIPVKTDPELCGNVVSMFKAVEDMKESIVAVDDKERPKHPLGVQG